MKLHKLSRNWSWTRLSKNAGWQENFWSICRIFTFQNYEIYKIYIIICFAMVKGNQVGGEQCSPCWENTSNPNWYQILNQLRCAGVISSVCIYDFLTHWTVFGKQPARRTTRVSECEAAWGTFGCSKFGRWRVLCRQQTMMDCQLKFVESFSQNKLGCTLAIVIGTWRFGACGVDFAITVKLAKWKEIGATAAWFFPS